MARDCALQRDAAEAYLQTTAAPSRAAARPSATLVIVYGQARGGATVWASLVRHVLVPLSADLALLCGGAASANCTHFYGSIAQRARYIWTRQEPRSPGNWGTILEMRPYGRKTMEVARRTGDDGSSAWGGTPFSEHAITREHVISRKQRLRVGSGAVTMETRAQLLERLHASGALNRHEWFVFTRPDVYVLCDHPLPSSFGRSGVTVAGPVCSRVPASSCRGRMAGPDYVNDRHAILHRSHVPAYLGVLTTALAESARRGRLWCGEKRPEDVFDAKTTCCCTTERLLSSHLNLSRTPVKHEFLPLLLVRHGAPSSPAASFHLPGSHIDDSGGSGAGRTGWFERASELDERTRRDLRCVRIPLELEFAAGVEACARARGSVRHAVHVLRHADGATGMTTRLLVGFVCAYAALMVIICVRRARGS